MALIHISESEAARDLKGILGRVRAGDEFLIESENLPRVLLSMAHPSLGTPLSEILKRVEERERERGYEVRMDADFAEDLEEIIRNRKPRDTSAWE